MLRPLLSTRVAYAAAAAAATYVGLQLTLYSASTNPWAYCQQNNM